MKIENPSQVLTLIMWVSVLILSWLLITRQVPSDALSWLFWVFFLVIAIFASAVASSKKG